MSGRAWLLLGLLSFIWGSSFLFIELALAVMGPLTLVFFRVFIGAMALLAYLRVRGKSLPSAASFWVAAAFMGLLNNAIPFSLIAYGQVFITAGLASIINANTAFFGVVVAALFIAEERWQWHRVLGVIVGVGGVITIIGPASLVSLDVTSLGQFAVVVATLSYACASVWGKLRLAGYAGDSIAAATLLSASIMMMPLMLIFEGMPRFEITLTLITVFVGLGVLGTSFAYILYFRILQLAGASNLMLVTIIVPLFAVLLDAVWLSQYLSMTEIAGFVIVALGLAVMDGRLLGYLRKHVKTR